MDSFTERRRYERYQERAGLVYARSGSGDYANADMADCSTGGMFLISRYAVDPGAEVCVKMIRYPAVFNARVVRCTRVATTSGPAYGIGIDWSPSVHP